MLTARADVDEDDHVDADQSQAEHFTEDLTSTGFSELQSVLPAIGSSSTPGGVTSRDKTDDKADSRDSTKTLLKSRGPGFAPVLRPEGSRDFYDTHPMCKYVYTGPQASTVKSSESAAAATKPAPVIKKKVHRKKFAGKRKEVEGPTTSSDNKGSAERPSKKAHMASSASVVHVQPLRDNDADDHNLMLLILTGGHGVFMAKAEPQDDGWYDRDHEWYDPDDG